MKSPSIIVCHDPGDAFTNHTQTHGEHERLVNGSYGENTGEFSACQPFTDCRPERTNGVGAKYDTQRQAAERNHTAILDAAHELFTTSPTASMNEVATRAGVGAGTLYRHFPTREDLILAVYRLDVLKLVGSVEKLLAKHPPLDAFVAWFDSLAAYVRLKHGLGEALHHAAVQNAIDETYAPVEGAVGRLLDACVTAGVVQPGLDPGDVLLVMGFLWRVAPGPAGVQQGSRVTQIVLNGIRPRPEPRGQPRREVRAYGRNRTPAANRVPR